MKKRRKWVVHSHVRSALRRVWLYSPMRQEALRSARVGRNSYLCAHCGALFAAKEVTVDHIEMVTPLGWKQGEWTSMVERLMVGPSGLQVLCRDICHKKKTKEENALRRRFKSEAKLDAH